ncbi:MAG TPA: GYD domain-containing protein, partial [Devosiaceae bacterium]|nr:GYD domain-containing protein [Devosiaceae bacterium]
MAKYVVLLNWTDQGIKTVKDSPKRYDAAKEVATKSGCTLETIYLTFGQYDQ